MIAGIALVLLVAGLGAGYGIGSATSHASTTTSTALSYVTVTEVATATGTVVVQNATYTGPGCPPPALVLMALRIPCIHYTNSTTWSASLLEYNGKYFYSTTETVALNDSNISTTYTVWFDNSTAYCVSPHLAVSELPTCPPP